jgi:hypothetical protein
MKILKTANYKEANKEYPDGCPHCGSKDGLFWAGDILTCDNCEKVVSVK